MKDLIKILASVVPSERQLKWFDTEFYAFVHFSPNTYTDREWGLGNEDPAIFNPEKLDCDQWVASVKAAGMKGLVLTAKHHDGFCLWPSEYTEHSIKNSPYKNGKGDIVKEAAEACARGGIKFGFYLSPWDRNSKFYGTPEYNDFYCKQLTELLTGYGEIFHVWFDGACGEGPDGKKQVYDYERYISLIRKYQPNATIYNDHGPDVRWCGNEGGEARAAEWAVVPSELCFRSELQTPPMPLCGDLSFMNNNDNDIGELDNILYSKGLVFAGSEIDMSIRPGWFWHEKEEPHSVDRLFSTYLRSVGSNCCFNLNVPPTRTGLFDERDVKRLSELGDKLKNEFALNKAENASITEIFSNDNGQSMTEIVLDGKKQLKYIELAEDLTKGQRIASFRILVPDGRGDWEKVFNGTCVGHKKICCINKETDKFRIYVTSSRCAPVFRSIKAF